jgi:thiamine biosynthesis lipoprotein
MKAKAPPVHRHEFSAMASPCEILIEAPAPVATQLAQLGEHEARRIEEKFTRYRPTGIVARINGSNGSPVEVDAETAGLLDYAAHCYRLSDGLFDITSGVLRRVWTFDGSDRVPSPDAVTQVLPLVGWDKVRWETPFITLPPGIEIDLGGICKEYAVDRAAQIILQAAGRPELPVLVNFGGDLRVTAPKSGGRPWKVAIEAVDQAQKAGGLIEISAGGLATSGDARRFLLKDGKRYSHILDPRAGFPVENAPRSITTAARTCVEAGTLATLAMLQGGDAENYLAKEGINSWVLR